MRSWVPLTQRLTEFRALRDAGVSVKTAAWRMGVSARSGRLYEQTLRNAAHEPPARLLERLREPVLALLRAHPGTAFSVCDLAHAVHPGARALSTRSGVLPRLVSDGLVDVVEEARDPGRDHRPVRRYRLARTIRNDSERNGTEVTHDDAP